MSKEKPEVGDVWVTTDEDEKVRVMYTFVAEEVLYVAVLIAQLTLDGEWVYFSEVLREPTFEDCTYLGKSKVSIEELFDVGEEENEKDNLATDLKQMVRDSAKQAREIIDNWNKGAV